MILDFGFELLHHISIRAPPRNNELMEAYQEY